MTLHPFKQEEPWLNILKVSRSKYGQSTYLYTSRMTVDSNIADYCRAIRNSESSGQFNLFYRPGFFSHRREIWMDKNVKNVYWQEILKILCAYVSHKSHDIVNIFYECDKWHSNLQFVPCSCLLRRIKYLHRY